MSRPFIVAARADALFASPIQPSDHANPAAVRAAIQEYVRRYGVRGLQAAVAAEYGDHPQEAAARMCWCLSEVASAYCCEPLAVAA